MFGSTKVLPFLGKHRCVFPLRGPSNKQDSSTMTGPFAESEQHNGSAFEKAKSEHSKIIENLKKEHQEQFKKRREESEIRRKQNNSE